MFSTYNKPTHRTPSISAVRYSKGIPMNALVESKSPGDASIDLASIKIKHFKSSYRIFTSMRTDGRTGLNNLTILMKPSPHESNPIHVYSYEGDSCSEALKTPVLLFVHASSVGHVSSNLRLCRSPVISHLKVTLAISRPCAWTPQCPRPNVARDRVCCAGVTPEVLSARHDLTSTVTWLRHYPRVNDQTHTLHPQEEFSAPGPPPAS